MFELFERGVYRMGLRMEMEGHREMMREWFWINENWKLNYNLFVGISIRKYRKWINIQFVRRGIKSDEEKVVKINWIAIRGMELDSFRWESTHTLTKNHWPFHGDGFLVNLIIVHDTHFWLKLLNWTDDWMNNQNLFWSSMILSFDRVSHNIDIDSHSICFFSVFNWSRSSYNF